MKERGRILLRRRGGVALAFIGTSNRILFLTLTSSFWVWNSLAFNIKIQSAWKRSLKN